MEKFPNLQVLSLLWDAQNEWVEVHLVLGAEEGRWVSSMVTVGLKKLLCYMVLSHMLLPPPGRKSNVYPWERDLALHPMADLKLEILYLSLYGATAASGGHCSSGLGSNFIKVLSQARQSHRGSLPAEASFRSVRWSRGPVPAFPWFYLSKLCGRYLPVCSFSGLDVFDDGILYF